MMILCSILLPHFNLKLLMMKTVQFFFFYRSLTYFVTDERLLYDVNIATTQPPIQKNQIVNDDNGIIIFFKIHFNRRYFSYPVR